MNSNKIWKIKSEKEILTTKILDVVELDCYLPSKSLDHDFITLRMNDWVNVFALSDDNKVILVRQHRIGKNIITLEVPAGVVNKNEKPENAVARELEEETGYVPRKIILMKSISVNPAIQNNMCHFFLATGCKKEKDTAFDPTEELEVVLKEKEEVFGSIFDSYLIESSLSLMCVLCAKEYMRSPFI